MKHDYDPDYHQGRANHYNAKIRRESILFAMAVVVLAILIAAAIVWDAT